MTRGGATGPDAVGVALVTGAARGIGRAIALRLADHGYDLVLVGRDLSESYERYGEVLDAPTVQDEVELRGRRAVACEEDLRDVGAAGRVVAAATTALGRVDVLVNNAGGALTPVQRSLASEMTVEDLDAMMLLNLGSAVALCQAVVPVMRAQEGGSIVNIGSRIAVDPSIADGRLAPYALSKTSLVQYTRLLAHEVGPAGIRVNCVSPGIVATARVMGTAAARGIGTPEDLDAIPMRRFATPDDVAGVVAFFASEDSAYVTGQVLCVDGGATLTPS